VQLRARLDTDTLVVVAVVVGLVPAVIGGLVWHTRRSYPGRWALGNLLAAIALWLLSLRGKMPDWATIVAANALFVTAGIVFLQGIRSFRGLSIPWWPECAWGAATVAGIAWYRYATDDINARILIVSIGLACIAFACGMTLLKDMPRGRRVGYVVTGATFTAAGALHLVRGVYLFSVAPVRDLFDSSFVNSLLFAGASLGMVAWSLGFMLLTSDRLQVREADAADVMEEDALEQDAPEGDFAEEHVAEEDVRQQLRRIVESKLFRRSAKMERFLTLAVERALAGRPEELKEYALGRDVFDRGEDYDPRTDSIVRVEAQRLRKKLHAYYETQGSGDEVFIALPPGSYVPTFRYKRGRPIG
jgi:hypothetical protein